VVRDDRERTDQELTHGEAEQTGDEYLAAAEPREEEPGEDGANKGGGVEADGHVEAVCGGEAGLLEKVPAGGERRVWENLTTSMKRGSVSLTSSSWRIGDRT
jgi:hypothetical protein